MLEYLYAEKGGVGMGIYLNPDNIDFRRALNSEIYIDKSMLIECTNSKIFTEQQFICVSRPRRFGKSMAANMLTAYYSRGCDSHGLFSGLKIAQSESFEKHLNQYNVIHLNMANLIVREKSIEDNLAYLSRRIIHELKKEYPDVDCFDWDNLVSVMEEIFESSKTPFIFVIDEWDCIFRIHRKDVASHTKYLDFLRSMLKDQSYVALAYMTGILPIKKYGEHSALNIFTEASMSNAREYAEFTGFTEGEVKKLCEKYDMVFDDMKRWYDGYNLKGVSIYNPRSVVMSVTGHDFDNYWTSTETYEALKEYISMNYDGLKDKVIELIAGEEIEINIRKFQNDMTTFRSADDILTLLVHLGYLTFDFYTGKARIPNSEVAQEFINSIEDGGWENVMKSIRQSDELLNATLACDEEKVAAIIGQAHSDNASILKYNDENSLACVVSIAYYSARKNYTVHREMPSGKGFADLVFVPRRNVNTPALVVELKYDKSADSAIEQIKNRNYADCLKEYCGDILLVGINYDKNDEVKKHDCKIERFVP